MTTKLPEQPSGFLQFFERLGYHLRYVGRFTLPDEIQQLANDFVKHHMEVAKAEIPAGTKYYRARLHKAAQNLKFSPTDMGAPEYGHSSSGRVSPEGISYLYMADSPETAIAEVRPWKSARVSVGSFETVKDLVAVDLSIEEKIPSFKGIPEDEIKKHTNAVRGRFLRNMYFSAPAHGEDRLAYLGSQYLAELFKNKKVDILLYKSVLRDGGLNVAAFNPGVARCTSVEDYYVESVQVMAKRGIGA